jgi:hypothetical protein
MARRSAHGKARELGRLVVSETTPADELPPATGSDPARAGRDAAGRFTPGNPWARLARAKAGPGGALASLDATAYRLDPPAPVTRPEPHDNGHAEMDAVDRDLELWAHVAAGRIRRRRGESSIELVRRLRAGDYVIVDNVIDFQIERARRAHRKAAGE